MDVNPESLVRPELETGVPGGRELLVFSDTVFGSDLGALNRARERLADVLGPAAVTAAAVTAAAFSKNDRIANGCGISIDPMVMKLTGDIREQLGLNEFRSAENTLRFMRAE